MKNGAWEETATVTSGTCALVPGKPLSARLAGHSPWELGAGVPVAEGGLRSEWVVCTPRQPPTGRRRADALIKATSAVQTCGPEPLPEPSPSSALQRTRLPARWAPSTPGRGRSSPRAEPLWSPKFKHGWRQDQGPPRGSASAQPPALGRPPCNPNTKGSSYLEPGRPQWGLSGQTPWKPSLPRALRWTAVAMQRKGPGMGAPGGPGHPPLGLSAGIGQTCSRWTPTRRGQWDQRTRTSGPALLRSTGRATCPLTGAPRTAAL